MNAVAFLLCVLCALNGQLDGQSNAMASPHSDHAVATRREFRIEKMFELRFILMNDTVADELDLSADQRAQVRETSLKWFSNYKAYQTKSRERLDGKSSRRPGMLDGEKRELFQLTESTETALEQLLSVQQRARVRELTIQCCSVKALAEKAFVAHLKLSPEQRRRIDETVISFSQRSSKLVEDTKSKKVSLEEFKKLSAIQTKELEDAVRKLLSTEQLDAWEAQKGVPAKFSLSKLEYRLELGPVASLELPVIPEALIPHRATMP